MSYVPAFKCDQCGKRVPAKIAGMEGELLQGQEDTCGCDGKLEAWEKQYREMMELRKKKRRTYAK